MWEPRRPAMGCGIGHRPSPAAMTGWLPCRSDRTVMGSASIGAWRLGFAVASFLAWQRTRASVQGSPFGKPPGRPRFGNTGTGPAKSLVAQAGPWHLPGRPPSAEQQVDLCKRGFKSECNCLTQAPDCGALRGQAAVTICLKTITFGARRSDNCWPGFAPPYAFCQSGPPRTRCETSQGVVTNRVAPCPTTLLPGSMRSRRPLIRSTSNDRLYSASG